MRAASRIGLISYTHWLLRPEAVKALAGCELILHAGDVGNPEILEELAKIAPAIAVRGNIDTGDWARRLPETAAVETRSARIYMLHDVHRLQVDPAAAGFRMVVSGHSHKPHREERAGVLYLNPGSAGPRRFRLPVTVVRLDLEKWNVEFIQLV